MDVKNNIKKIREALHYSQEYVALQVGITQQAYQLIEGGGTKTTAEFLVRLAPVLHVRVEQFFGVETKQEEKPLTGSMEMFYAEKLIEVYNMLVESKDEHLATKDKVIELLTNGKGRKGYKRA